MDVLGYEETSSYIQYRLAVAGLSEPRLFDDEAVAAIYGATGGVPRRINILCDTALMCGFADEKQCIDRHVVADAIKELGWQKPAFHGGIRDAGRYA